MSYIDTSVLVAYYWRETLSPAAQAEIRSLAAPAISALSEVEYRSALSLKIRIGEMRADEARGVLTAFRLHCSEGVYRRVPIEARTYDVASEWLAAFSTPLRTLDALHLAAAFLNDLVLVTADKDLAASAKHLGVRHKLIP